MLRSSLRSVRVPGSGRLAAPAARQWPIAASRGAGLLATRSFADQKKANDDVSKAPVLPTSETLSSERSAVPADLGESKPRGVDHVPRTPPTAPEAANSRPRPTTTMDDVGESKVMAAAAGLEAKVPRKKGFFRRLRSFVFTLILLGAVGFGGGVWYSRVNDKFHDFFTEYIPFGEQAVLYLEEMEFRKRFPDSARGDAKSRDGERQVRIPAQSGASWRVADSGEHSGRHSSANPVPKKPAVKQPVKQAESPKEAAKIPPPPKPVASEAAPAAAKEAVRENMEKKESAGKAFKAPEVDEPSRLPPLPPIDLMALPDAKEPVVRDLVHMLNDLIIVINADGAHGKYGTTINKAKDEMAKIGDRLRVMKDGIEKKAARRVNATVQEFDKAANDIVRRVEGTMVAQEVEWRREFEEEMVRVRESYDERVKLLLEREQKLNEERLHNQLLEQALALKREFVQEVRDRVEKEREGRLGKLTELSSAVADLEKLTVGWNDVVDTNLKTQQLHVAVEAVRASLEDSQHPRPFIRELVALKEIAAESPVVNAAIASVNPTAYQRGISTSSQLIDRFRRVAGEVRKASLLPEDAGVASHASSWVLSHVLFKKDGLAGGHDVESILTRTQTYLEEGDLDSAAREMNSLQGWARTLSKDWLGEVRKVLEVQQALEVIATEARLQSLRLDQ
ncbi:mitochondrion protein [Drechmeria coniospora]|uniref:MICOS complex subunit MIC60 n=1 Tax=Drechmeria coniospora TaxID=98403 RepID=A0A151GAQ1_DRECN|nr:mitochondrion protein [Drechmeria coniospora]KYK54169.1 mitochondrion protein [Drechmeria coniospora]